MKSVSLKRTFLWLLVVSLTITGLYGIYVFISGDFGEFQVNVILTTLSLSFFSLTALGNALGIEKDYLSWLAWIGLLVAVLGFFLSLGVIWELELPAESNVLRGMLLGMIWSFASAHVLIISMISLPEKWRWTVLITDFSIVVLGLLLSFMVVNYSSVDTWIRPAGVFGVIVGIGSIVIPILYKISRMDEEERETESKVIFEAVPCPNCGHEFTVKDGETVCPECGTKIILTIEEP